MPETENPVLLELEAIRQDHGGMLRAEDVVAAARPKGHPLHSRFTWDDSEAARQYRLWQARELIRVCVRLIPGTDHTIKAYVSLQADREEDGGGYRSSFEVFTDPQLRNQALTEALEEMRVFDRKYKGFSELGDVLKAHRRALAKLES